MAGFGIFFEYQGRVIRLPVNPEQLRYSVDGDNQSASIVGLGERTVIKSPKLTSFTIESYFPRNADYPWIQTLGEFKQPEFYIGFFNAIREAKDPMKFVGTGYLNKQMAVTIERFEYGPTALTYDLAYTLELKEYKEIKARTIPLVTPPPASPGSSSAPAKVNTTPPAPVRENPAKIVTVGANVMITGQLHKDSAGGGPGATKSNYKGKVSIIKKGTSCPYHVTTTDGAWLGWVTAAAVKVI